MRRRIVTTGCFEAVLAGIAALAAPARWLRRTSRFIRVADLSAGAQRTPNLVFADATNRYIGQAAPGTAARADTNGCTSPSRLAARSS